MAARLTEGNEVFVDSRRMFVLASRRTAAAMLTVFVLSGRPAAADLADQDPQALCRTLEPLGMVTTPYESPGAGQRPLCFTAGPPAEGPAPRVAYRYAVLAHWAEDYPQALWLSVEGVAADIAGRAPRLRFMEMADRALRALVSDDTRLGIVMALRSLRPGDNLWQMVEGLSIQLRWIEPAPRPGSGYASVRLDIANVCGDLPRGGASRQACLADYWVADRPFSEARLP